MAKPQTQMNLSGRAVQHLLSYYKVEGRDLLVIHDDIDLEFLQTKFQKGRGHGGHNGVRNIHEQLGHSDYYRLRLGVGRTLSQKPVKLTSTAGVVDELSRAQKIGQVSKHVLSPFSKEELAPLEEFLVQSVQVVTHFISQGGESAIRYLSQKKSL